MDLERKFLLWLFVLLVMGCIAYSTLDTQRVFIAPLMLIVGVGAVASGVVHYVLLKPIRRLVVMAHAVGAGDFSRRLGLARRDEIGSLAAEMDAMCDQLEAARRAHEVHVAALEQLRHSDRIATLGVLASSVAHELGNPLSVIENQAQLITSCSATMLHQAPKKALVIVEQTQRMTRIIEEILSFARMQPAKIARLDLTGVLRKAIALSQYTAKKYETSIVLDLPETPMEIDGDADKLLQIVVNLAINGIQAMPRGGKLRVSANRVLQAPIEDPDSEPKNYVRIDVSDDGIGIAADLVPRVFEPFFSTRVADGGTGLGLSVAQGIAREHEGWIAVESEPGRGSMFTVHLPENGLRGSHGN